MQILPTAKRLLLGALYSLPGSCWWPAYVMSPELYSAHQHLQTQDKQLRCGSGHQMGVCMKTYAYFDEPKPKALLPEIALLL